MIISDKSNMLANVLTKSIVTRPFMGSLSESTQVRYRWWKDNLENVKIKRRGYNDTLKQEGPLPRFKDEDVVLLSDQSSVSLSYLIIFGLERLIFLSG